MSRVWAWNQSSTFVLWLFFFVNFVENKAKPQINIYHLMSKRRNRRTTKVRDKNKTWEKIDKGRVLCLNFELEADTIRSRTRHISLFHDWIEAFEVHVYFMNTKSIWSTTSLSNSLRDVISIRKIENLNRNEYNWSGLKRCEEEIWA